MASVTVPGTGSSTIGQIFGNANNAAIAQQIADAINAADTAGRLIVKAPPGKSGNVPPPPTNPGGINELVISKGGDYTIPPGSGAAPDYVVILNSTDPVTIHGAPNSSIWGGGGGQVTIIDPATITLSEGAGNAVVTLTGARDTLAGNNQDDTLTAVGNKREHIGRDGQQSGLPHRQRRYRFRSGRRDSPVRVQCSQRRVLRRRWCYLGHRFRHKRYGGGR